MAVVAGGFQVAAAGTGAGAPYLLLGPAGVPVEPVQDYLSDLFASDCSPLTIKSYAYDLLDWFRFLQAAGVGWEQADRRLVREWVLAAKAKPNPQRRRRADRPPPGSVNPRTGKASLGAGYAGSTINHRLSVVGAFYAYQHELGRGPGVNPVPAGQRQTHRNPMEPWRAGRRGRYRQKTPKRVPRAIPDELYEAVFAALTCDRDRAIVSLLVSSGARAAELLGMAGADVDWAGRRVRLVGKGTGEAVWVAASPDFFGWLARYLADERGPLQATGPLWLTLRGPARPLSYQALRAVLLRVNDKLGANLVLHDFRHTCAVRLASDPAVPLTDVQAHLRHRHLTTTQRYLVARPEDVVRRVQAHQHAGAAADPVPAGVAWTYQAGDLAVLLGSPPP